MSREMTPDERAAEDRFEAFLRDLRVRLGVDELDLADPGGDFDKWEREASDD